MNILKKLSDLENEASQFGFKWEKEGLNDLNGQSFNKLMEIWDQAKKQTS